MNKLKLAGLIVLFIFMIIQFFGPERTNPPVDKSRTVMALTHMPDHVAKIINRSCRDCHTYQTKWPWYSYIAPVSWLVIDDVNEGRRHINFSDWARYSPKKVAKALDEICEEVEDGTMPLKSYLWIHRDARLTEEEVQAICNWTKSELGEFENKTEENDGIQ